MRLVARAALHVYGLEPARLSLLTHAHNTLFAVRNSAGARYVLRLHAEETESRDAEPVRRRVESELWWLRRLRHDLALDFPVPISARDGRDVVPVSAAGIEGTWHAVLFAWVDGRFLDRGLATGHLRQVGRLTARLHNHSETLAVPDGFERPRVAKTDAKAEGYAVRLFHDFWSARSAAILRETYGRVREAEESMGYGSDVFGLIHADIHQRNYLFHRGQVRLLDFDDSGWGTYLYDLAVSLTEIADLPRYPELRAALLAGYREVRSLSAAQEALIEPFFMLRHAENLTFFLDSRNDPLRRERVSLIDPGLAVLERFLTTGP